MKVKYLKLKNWLLVTVMGAFGLSACHCHKEAVATEPEEAPQVKPREEIRLMYGVPTMNYMIRGQVKDTHGRPVRDIRVNMLERGMQTDDEGTLVGDSKAIDSWLQDTEVRTDEKGRFTIASSGLPQEEVRLLVRDVDGKENGEYRNQVVDLPVKPEDMDRTEAGGWDQGTFNKEVKIKLKKK